MATLSPDFITLVKSIGESKSKTEEDVIVQTEVQVLKKKMTEKGVDAKRMKEFIIRMLYVEMLGHDFSFGHIHAVNLTHDKSLMEKRVGYLGVSLCLHAEHELMLLLINTLQLDLKSDNQLEVAMALIVVSRLVNRETLPALLPLVVKALDHAQPNVRKKAVSCLHRFFLIDSSSLNNLVDKIKRTLCDKDPSVMGACLPLLRDMAVSAAAGNSGIDLNSLKELVPSLVSIIRQVTEHRLPRDFDYHRMPAPWIQMRLLQLLAVLGNADKVASESMYDALHEVLKRADMGINVGHAVVYECVRTITSIYPSATLFEEAAGCVARLLTADNNNLKYLGINALASIVHISPRHAAEHQLIVIDCLEDPDETLRRKTLDLLYRMTNPANVCVIIDKLISHLRTAQDAFLRAELVSRITSLAERYAPNNAWYIQTMNTVFELGGSLVRPQMAHNMMRLVSEGGAGSHSADGQPSSDIRHYASESYLHLLTRYVGASGSSVPLVLPDALLQVIAWVLGECVKWVDPQQASTEQLLFRLLDMMSRPASSSAGTSHSVISSSVNSSEDRNPSLPSDPHMGLSSSSPSSNSSNDECNVRVWIMTALLKITAYFMSVHSHSSLPPGLLDDVSRFQASSSTDLQQRAYEFVELVKAPSTLVAVLPPDGHSQAIDVDENLSFLNGYVQEALSNGASPYDPSAHSTSAVSPSDGTLSAVAASGHGLKFTPYQAPSKPVAVTASQVAASGASLATAVSANTIEAAPVLSSSTASSAPALKLSSSKKVWGPDGYNDDKKPEPSPAPVATPTPAVSAGELASAAAAAQVQQQQQQQQSVAAKRAAAPSSEKEKLAAALFSGVSNSSGGLFSAAPALSKPVAVAAPVAAPAVQNKQDDIDLLDMAFAAVKTSSVAAAPAASNQFDIFGGSSTPAATVASAATKAASPIDDLDILLSGSSFSKPSVPVSVAATSASADPLDLLSSFSSSASSTSRSLPPLGYAGSSASTRSRIETLPGREAEVVVQAGDGSQSLLHVSYIKARAEVSPAVAIFITNTSSSHRVASAALQLSLPAAMTSTLIYSEPVAPQSANPNVIQLPMLEPASTCALLLSILPSQLAAIRSATSSAAPASLAFVDPVSSARKSVDFQLAFSLPDLLRPASMTTANFGQNWKQHAQECKILVPSSSCSTSPEFMSRIQRFLNAFPVETIGLENIVAARGLLTAGNAASPLVLLHAKIKPAGPVASIEAMVRSSDKDFSAAVASVLQALLK